MFRPMERVCLELATKAPIIDTTKPPPLPVGTGHSVRTPALLDPDANTASRLAWPGFPLAIARNDLCVPCPSCDNALNGGAAPP